MSYRVIERSGHIDVYFRGGLRASYLPGFEGKEGDPENGEAPQEARPARVFLKVGLKKQTITPEFDLQPDMFRQVFQCEDYHEHLSSSDENLQWLARVRQEYFGD